MATYGLGRGLDALIARKAPLSAPLPSVSAPAPSSTAADAPRADEQIFDIALDLIDPNPDQPRSTFKEASLEELAQSIREFGVIQPLIVMRVGERYRLIAGERRWRASKIAGRRTIPAVTRTPRQHEDFAIAMIENVQREDLNPIELALGYQRLLDDYCISHQELADKLGVSRPVISNTLRLLRLPEAIVQAIQSGVLSAYAARSIGTIDDPAKQLEFFYSLNGDYNSEAMIGKAKVFTGKPRRTLAKNADPTLSHKEELLREQFGTRVDIHRTPGGTGSVNIFFYTDEEMADLIARLIA